MNLNEKQKRFCEEYLIDLNGKQAAIRSGYSLATANEQSSRLLTNVNVQTYISQLKEKRNERLQIKQDDVIKEISKIAYSDIKNFLSFGSEGVVFKDSNDVDGSQISEVSSVKTTNKNGSGENVNTTERVNMKLKLHDKMKALEMLGRHINLFGKEISFDTDIVVVLPKEFGEDNT